MQTEQKESPRHRMVMLSQGQSRTERLGQRTSTSPLADLAFSSTALVKLEDTAKWFPTQLLALTLYSLGNHLLEVGLLCRLATGTESCGLASMNMLATGKSCSCPPSPHWEWVNCTLFYTRALGAGVHALLRGRSSVRLLKNQIFKPTGLSELPKC